MDKLDTAVGSKCVRCKKDAPPRLAKLEAKYRPANHVQPGAVTIVILLPHSIHQLQPLDISLFQPLSIYYSTVLNIFIYKSNRIVSMSQGFFLDLFKPV